MLLKVCPQTQICGQDKYWKRETFIVIWQFIVFVLVLIIKKWGWSLGLVYFIFLVLRFYCISKFSVWDQLWRKETIFFTTDKEQALTLSYFTPLDIRNLTEVVRVCLFQVTVWNDHRKDTLTLLKRTEKYLEWHFQSHGLESDLDIDINSN